MSFYFTHFSPTRFFQTLLGILFIGSLAAGCVTIQNTTEGSHITVSGRAVVMGNVPFTALILETEGRNSYILKMDDSMRDSLMTPAQIEVEGRLYLAEWNGKPFAHIDVSRIQRID